MIGSILIAPACDAERLRAAVSSEAATLVIDLRGAPAREAAADALSTATRRGRSALLAIDGVESDLSRADLSALSALAPDGVLLSRAETAADIQHLGAILAVEEARAGLADGSIGIVALAETGVALFGLNALAGASRRTKALGWDGEALARDLGAETARDAGGRWCDPCQTARTLTLAACADGRLPAIDAPFTGADPATFEREAEQARRDGFLGKFCLDAEQVAIANAVFARR